MQTLFKQEKDRHTGGQWKPHSTAGFQPVELKNKDDLQYLHQGICRYIVYHLMEFKGFRRGTTRAYKLKLQKKKNVMVTYRYKNNS